MTRRCGGPIGSGRLRNEVYDPTLRTFYLGRSITPGNQEPCNKGRSDINGCSARNNWQRSTRHNSPVARPTRPFPSSLVPYLTLPLPQRPNNRLVMHPSHISAGNDVAFCKNTQKQDRKATWSEGRCLNMICIKST